MTSADMLDTVLSIAAVPVTTILCGMLMKLYSHFDKTATAQDKANMEAELQAAIGSGYAALQQAAPGLIQGGPLSPRARDIVLNAATNYFRVRFPDRAAQITAMVSGTGQQPNAAVQQTIDSRLALVNSGTPLVAPVPGVASGSKPPPAPTLQPLPP